MYKPWDSVTEQLMPSSCSVIVYSQPTSFSQIKLAKLQTFRSEIVLNFAFLTDNAVIFYLSQDEQVHCMN